MTVSIREITKKRNPTKRLLWIPDPPGAVLCVNDEPRLALCTSPVQQGIETANLPRMGFDGDM